MGAGALALGGSLALPRLIERPERSRPSGAPDAPTPVQVREAGYRNLVFHDDFDDPATVDAAGAGGAGFKWYRDLPFSWGATQPSEYRISQSVLTLTPAARRANWTLATASPATRNGTTFGPGYFEARLRYAARDPGTELSWPAFWSLSAAHTFGLGPPTWAELDFFEAHGGAGPNDYRILGTLHQWDATGNVQNTNNQSVVQADVSQWHNYGCLWEPGGITWFFDGQPLHRQTFSPDAEPSPSASRPRSGALAHIDREPQGMVMILGTGPEWPLEVDRVSVIAR